MNDMAGVIYESQDCLCGKRVKILKYCGYTDINGRFHLKSSIGKIYTEKPQKKGRINTENKELIS